MGWRSWVVNRSSWTRLLRGSGLGGGELLSSADEYRAVRPRTYTYLPWLTLMPATRVRASAAVLSPWRSRSCFDTWVMIAGLASIGSGMYSPRTSTASRSVDDDGAAACSVAGACGSACACWASALAGARDRQSVVWGRGGSGRVD